MYIVTKTITHLCHDLYHILPWYQCSVNATSKTSKIRDQIKGDNTNGYLHGSIQPGTEYAQITQFIIIKLNVVCCDRQSPRYIICYWHTPSQESERSYICVLGAYILPLSMIVVLDFVNILRDRPFNLMWGWGVGIGGGLWVSFPFRIFFSDNTSFFSRI